MNNEYKLGIANMNNELRTPKMNNKMPHVNNELLIWIKKYHNE